MGRSRRLRVGEVRAAVRLAAECRDLGADFAAWRGHLLAGVRQLVRAEHVMVGELGPAGFRTFADLGWPTPAARPDWLNWVKTATAADHPAAARFSAVPGACKTRHRRQLLTDAEWYPSWVYADLLGPAGLDDGLLSACPQPDGAAHFIVPARAVGDRRFGGREVRLIHLLHAELGPALGGRLATSTDPVAGLSPRLRQTLDCLLDGDSEKAAALRLGVARSTVRGYVQAVYRHFGVNSRAALLADFLKRYRRP